VTDDPKGFEEIPFDPASMSTSSLGMAKAVWYKRPWFLVTVAIVLIVAISIITDLPHPITKAQDAATQDATLRSINGDLKACAYAVNESFDFYNSDVSGKLTKSNLSKIPALLTGDQTACSFASQPVYDLTNNIQPLGTTAGKFVDHLLRVVQQWMTNNALASIEDIQYLFAHPGDVSKIHDLTTQQVRLASNRQLALSDVTDAEAVLGIALVKVNLPVLPHLIGT
jgi:hypothetical protein